KAFTLGYPDFGADFNELDEARAVAKHLGVQHYVYAATSKDLIDNLQAMVWYYDEPFADAAALNVLVLCGLVRSHVTVALGGEGSDELFGGYRRYQTERWMRRLGPLAMLLRRLVQLGHLPQIPGLPRRLQILLRSLAEPTAGSRYSAYFEGSVPWT